jgi:hypothetical protein
MEEPVERGPVLVHVPAQVEPRFPLQDYVQLLERKWAAIASGEGRCRVGEDTFRHTPPLGESEGGQYREQEGLASMTSKV